MIGLSASFCVKSILEGKVEEKDVEYIITSTCAENKQELESVVAGYRKSYWHKNPEMGEAIFWRLWAADKLYQPIIEDGGRPHYPGGKTWVDSLDPPFEKVPCTRLGLVVG